MQCDVKSIVDATQTFLCPNFEVKPGTHPKGIRPPTAEEKMLIIYIKLSGRS